MAQCLNDVYRNLFQALQLFQRISGLGCVFHCKHRATRTRLLPPSSPTIRPRASATSPKLLMQSFRGLGYGLRVFAYVLACGHHCNAISPRLRLRQSMALHCLHHERRALPRRKKSPTHAAGGILKQMQCFQPGCLSPKSSLFSSSQTVSHAIGVWVVIIPVRIHPPLQPPHAPLSCLPRCLHHYSIIEGKHIRS
jgi:hypothetical protein